MRELNGMSHKSNGINWTSHTTKISNFYGVTYGGGLFVAVSDGYLLGTSNQTNRNIYTSPDGITWTARNSGSPVTDVHSIRDVAYGAGRFVAVDGQGYFYTSTTGSTWTRSYTSNAGGRVSYCNSLFIVPAGSGANLVSADGLTWSLLMNNTASTFGRVIYTNGLYAALSGTNVFTSTPDYKAALTGLNQKNGIVRNFSSATVVSGPWPGQISVSAGSVKSVRAPFASPDPTTGCRARWTRRKSHRPRWPRAARPPASCR
jgi:hypothetical protein